MGCPLSAICKAPFSAEFHDSCVAPFSLCPPTRQKWAIRYFWPSNQKDRAVAAATEATKQTARAQAYIAQIHNDNGRYFEAALAGLTNPLTLDTDPAQTAPWGELVRATVADGFLVPPLRHDSLVLAATFDAAGARVVTASYDKTARIWDARTGEPIGKKLQHDGLV